DGSDVVDSLRILGVQLDGALVVLLRKIQQQKLMEGDSDLIRENCRIGTLAVHVDSVAVHLSRHVDVAAQLRRKRRSCGRVQRRNICRGAEAGRGQRRRRRFKLSGKHAGNKAKCQRKSGKTPARKRDHMIPLMCSLLYTLLSEPAREKKRAVNWPPAR